jgi:hypothetical protein
VGPLGGDRPFRKNSLDRTLRNTGVTIDTGFGVNYQHIVVEVKSFDRTN